MDNFDSPPSNSSSANSTSSVRNPYDYSSYKLRKTSTSSSEFHGVKYKCDLPAPCQEAWREGTLDPGRRFFGCSQFKDPSKKCNFFLWADPSYPERVRDVIKELKLKLRRKDEELQICKADMSFIERKMTVLGEEVDLLRKQNLESSSLLEKMKKNCCIMKRFLVIAVVVILVMCLF
ncbi:hypothetical protein ACET3Z_023600 [Daucus carota]